MGLGIQNEIFFDDVKLSEGYLPGELNRDFYHVIAALEFGRTGYGVLARAKEVCMALCGFAGKECGVYMLK